MRLPAWGSGRALPCQPLPWAPVSRRASHRSGLSSLRAVAERRRQDQRNRRKLFPSSSFHAFWCQRVGWSPAGGGAPTRPWRTVTPLPPTSLCRQTPMPLEEPFCLFLSPISHHLLGQPGAGKLRINSLTPIASCSLRVFVSVGETVLPGSSEPLGLPLAGLRALAYAIGGRGGTDGQHRVPWPRAQPRGRCPSRECCPPNPCSKLPQHEDYKETKALLNVPFSCDFLYLCMKDPN